MLYRCGLGRLPDTDRVVQAAVPPLAAPPVLSDTFYMDPAAYRVLQCCVMLLGLTCGMQIWQSARAARLARGELEQLPEWKSVSTKPSNIAAAGQVEQHRVAQCVGLMVMNTAGSLQ